ncbi:MAG: membrane lipoprotein lipid attachment site-containing protein, partial [Prevotellaceae bacterium]|nr:membrane lipoprotein lipid attachment site-containing protein [Candidatus Faecinaster equi]
MRKIILALVAGVILTGCSKQAEWPVDVFYIVSTNVISSQDEEGNEVYNATLTQA